MPCYSNVSRGRQHIITWELVRNAESQASLQTYDLGLALSKDPLVIPEHIKV